MRRFYGQFIKSENLCFDVGANIGIYSRTFLDLGARVVAVEPIDENIKILRQHFIHSDKLDIVQAAVSGSPGIGEISKGNFLDLSTLDKSFVQFNEKQSGSQWTETQSVKLVTMDELIHAHGIPGFCKIDVEGHELEVIRGLSTIIPIISFEFLFPFKEKSLECIKQICQLSPNAIFNYSLFEFFELENTDWLDGKLFSTALENLPPTHWTGDIFCKLID